MRDGLTCPIGAQWVVAFWSRKDLSKILDQPTRNIIFTLASLSALRLEQLTQTNFTRMGSCTRLTPREIAVLRLIRPASNTGKWPRRLGLVKRQSEAT